MKTVTQSRIMLLLVCFLLSVIGSVSCAPQAYRLIDITPVPIEAPDGYYQDIAWLEPEALAMDYMPTANTHNVETQLMVLDPISGSHYLLADEIPSVCHETRYGRITSLPDGRLGYLWECVPHKGFGRDFRLHEWDQTMQIDQELYRYPIPFWATAFSFAPVMDRWLQEQSGDSLSNKLHFVEPGAGPVRLLENSFARAGHPFWLADNSIIFAGTPQLPESDINLFSGLPGIGSILSEPWNIYLTDLDSLLDESVGEEQIILSGIQYIESVRVSPDRQFASFLGTIDNNQGLWIYRLESGELARLWAGFGPYDWSPDSSAIMLLVREPEQKLFRGRPARIELPASLRE